MNGLGKTLGIALAAVVAATPLGACATGSADSAAAQEAQVADVLRMALDDEYKAEATYEAVLAKFGEDVRPFTNIIRAEQHHAQMAKAEMDRLGISYPATNPYSGTIAAPATLLAACEAGIIAEEENIALYDRLLPQLADGQEKDVLTKLQWASRERHLPAFERCVARGGTMGGGPGGGHGGGKGRGGHGGGHGGGQGPGWN